MAEVVLNLSEMPGAVSASNASAAAVASAEFRRVLGLLPTGVTILTAHGANGPVGMTANSFTSVSLDPPLVLVCPAKSSATWESIRTAGKFCVNILAGHHEALSRRFAGGSPNRFEGVTWEPRDCGPAITDSVAWINVALLAEHDAGDHTIAVGRVLSLEAAAASHTLVFFRGQYISVESPQLSVG